MSHEATIEMSHTSYIRIQSQTVSQGNYSNSLGKLYKQTEDCRVARLVCERLYSLGYTVHISMINATYKNGALYHNEHGRLIIITHNLNPRVLELTLEMIVAEVDALLYVEKEDT